MSQRVGVAIVGCGYIASSYVRTLQPYPQIELVGATDLMRERAEALAASFDGKAYPSLEALLTDDGVDIVVNLTTHHAHASVTAQGLAAGKHVYSEKPLASTYAEASELVELAARNGTRLSCAPISFMGEAQQAAWKLVRDGRLGPVRVAYAELNWGRIESWHPSPAPFYEVGPLVDVGPYPLTFLTTVFGPVRRVLAYGRVLYPSRTTLDGASFDVLAPDFIVAVIEFASGPVARLSANFYVSLPSSHQRGIELHGDAGSLFVGNVYGYNADLELVELDGTRAPVSLAREPYPGTEWGRGVVDLAEAIATGRRHRATGEQAAHVVEIFEAARRSLSEGQAVELRSEFAPPEPMEWAEDLLQLDR